MPYRRPVLRRTAVAACALTHHESGPVTSSSRSGRRSILAAGRTTLSRPCPPMRVCGVERRATRNGCCCGLLLFRLRGSCSGAGAHPIRAEGWGAIACARKDHRVDSQPHERTSRPGLFTFAGHLVIPVHERAVGVVPPSPDVQFEMCRQAVSVRAARRTGTFAPRAPADCCDSPARRRR